MLDLRKLTTKTGGRIEIVFEDNFAQNISKDISQDDFQQQIREIVDKSGLSAKEGEVIYLLVNSYGRSRCMSKSDYDEWNKAEKKDWGHKELRSIPPFLGAIIGDIVLSDILGGLVSGDIIIEVHSYDMNVGEFTGPSNEQLDEIAKLGISEIDPMMRKIAADGNCKACTDLWCRGRSSSFSMEAFKEIFGQTTKS